MTTEDLVTIAKYSNPHEASMARAMLESHGIHGLVVGGEINNTLWHLGTTISGVELQVPSSEATQATEILDTFRRTKRSPDRGHWICSQCGEEVDADFEVCWSCGASVDQAVKKPADLPAEESEAEIEKEWESPESSPTPDVQARRALKAAVIGILFVPILFYALYLLLQLSTEELSKPALKQYYQAAFIVLLMLSFWLGMFGAFSR